MYLPLWHSKWIISLVTPTFLHIKVMWYIVYGLVKNFVTSYPTRISYIVLCINVKWNVLFDITVIWLTVLYWYAGFSTTYSLLVGYHRAVTTLCSRFLFCFHYEFTCFLSQFYPSWWHFYYLYFNNFYGTRTLCINMIVRPLMIWVNFSVEFVSAYFFNWTSCGLWTWTWYELCCTIWTL